MQGHAAVPAPPVGRCAPGRASGSWGQYGVGPDGSPQCAALTAMGLMLETTEERSALEPRPPEELQLRNTNKHTEVKRTREMYTDTEQAGSHTYRLNGTQHSRYLSGVRQNIKTLLYGYFCWQYVIDTLTPNIDIYKYKHTHTHLYINSGQFKTNLFT